MKAEIWEKIREFNRRAKQAEKDGYTVSVGIVWESWGDPFKHAKPLCRVEEYPDCVRNV